MADVKGVIVNAMRAYLNEMYSRDALDRALAALTPEDAALLDRRFLDSSSYPHETMGALRRLMRSVATKPGEAEVLGAYMAKFVFTGAYKPLLARTAEEMVQKISSIKEFFYRGTRDIEGQMTGPFTCSITYRYEPGVRPTRSVCQTNQGFWGKVLELASGSKTTGSHPTCVCEGAERCEFAFSWQASNHRPPAADRGPGSSG